MARGFLSGFVVGTAMLACAAAVTSFVVGPPAPPEISVDLGTAGVTPPRSAELSGPVPIQGGGVSSKPQKPAVVDAPEVERQAKLDIEAVRPASRPTAGDTSADVSEPATPGETSGVSVDGDAPVAANRTSAAPELPAGEDPAAIVTNPPLPAGSGVAGAGPGPSVGDGLRVPEPAEEDRPVVPGADRALAPRLGAPLAQSSPDQPRRPEVLVQSAPQPDTDIAAPSEAGDTTGQSDTLIAPSPDESSSTPTAPARAQAPEPEAAPSAGPLPRAGAAANDTGATRDIVLPQAGSTGTETGRVAPAIGTPATSLLQRDVGQAAPVEDAAEGETDDAAAATEVDPPAMVQNAEPFETTAGAPLMSIILMDTGQDRDEDTIGLAALRSFPYPLSFAVDTALPDAAERAEAYRAAGYEVLALVNLPSNLTAADTEVALTAGLARVPQAVGVLEGTETGLQGSNEMSLQVAAILAETGHGIVWQPGRLDTARRHAARSGVASRSLFRDLDSQDQTPLVIRRALDQAAFKASQEGSVVMVGRMRPETISALLVWGLQDRAQRVVVTPVSTVLLADQQSG